MNLWVCVQCEVDYLLKNDMTSSTYFKAKLLFWHVDDSHKIINVKPTRWSVYTLNGHSQCDTNHFIFLCLIHLNRTYLVLPQILKIIAKDEMCVIEAVVLRFSYCHSALWEIVTQATLKKQQIKKLFFFPIITVHSNVYKVNGLINIHNYSCLRSIPIYFCLRDDSWRSKFRESRYSHWKTQLQQNLKIKIIFCIKHMKPYRY